MIRERGAKRKGRFEKRIRGAEWRRRKILPHSQFAICERLRPRPVQFCPRGNNFKVLHAKSVPAEAPPAQSRPTRSAAASGASVRTHCSEWCKSTPGPFASPEVEGGVNQSGSAEVFPIGVPVAVYSGYPQSEHVFRVLDAPPGAGPLETLLGDVAMRAFDFARSDRQSLGQRLSIVQLVLAAAQITMASAHRRLFVVDFRRFAMTDERPQRHLETPVSERVLLRLDPGFPRGGVGRDRFGGGAQILANMSPQSIFVTWLASGGRTFPR